MVQLTRALLGLTDRRVCALHRCDTPLCVNESHLFVGSVADNNRDKASKGRDRNQFDGAMRCKRDHEFTAANTAVFIQNGTEHRRCIECRRKHGRDYHARKRMKHSQAVH